MFHLTPRNTVKDVTVGTNSAPRHANCFWRWFFILDRDMRGFKPLSPYPKIFSKVPFDSKSPPLSDRSPILRTSMYSFPVTSCTLDHDKKLVSLVWNAERAPTVTIQAKAFPRVASSETICYRAAYFANYKHKQWENYNQIDLVMMNFGPFAKF